MASYAKDATNLNADEMMNQIRKTSSTPNYWLNMTTAKRLACALHTQYCKANNHDNGDSRCQCSFTDSGDWGMLFGGAKEGSDEAWRARDNAEYLEVAKEIIARVGNVYLCESYSAAIMKLPIVVS